MFLQDSCSFCLLSWRYTDRSRDWSIASGRTSWSVGAQRTLPRDLRQAIAFESQTWKFYLCFSLWYPLSFFHPIQTKPWDVRWGLLILTSMPISAIYPSSVGFPVVGRTTRNYRHISKTSFRCLFPPDGNRSVLRVSSRAINETPRLNETKSLIRGNIVPTETSRPCRRVALEATYVCTCIFQTVFYPLTSALL